MLEIIPIRRRPRLKVVPQILVRWIMKYVQELKRQSFKENTSFLKLAFVACLDTWLSMCVILGRSYVRAFVRMELSRINLEFIEHTQLGLPTVFSLSHSFHYQIRILISLTFHDSTCLNKNKIINI